MDSREISSEKLIPAFKRAVDEARNRHKTISLGTCKRFLATACGGLLRFLSFSGLDVFVGCFGGCDGLHVGFCLVGYV